MGRSSQTRSCLVFPRSTKEPAVRLTSSLVIPSAKTAKTTVSFDLFYLLLGVLLVGGHAGVLSKALAAFRSDDLPRPRNGLGAGWTPLLFIDPEAHSELLERSRRSR